MHIEKKSIKDTHILDNAFEGGIQMSLEEVLDRAAGFSARYVSVTGGEPLAQQACLALLTSLCDAGYRVSLETSGAQDLSAVDPRVTRVMDLKTPDPARWSVISTQIFNIYTPRIRSSSSCATNKQ